MATPHYYEHEFSKVLHTTPLKTFRPRNLYAPSYRNKWGYFPRISCSGSQVASDISWLAQMTFTRGTVFLRRCLSHRSRICISCSSYDRSSWSCIGSGSIMSEGSKMYFRNCNTWNALCTLGSSGSSSSQSATSQFPVWLGTTRCTSS